MYKKLLYALIDSLDDSKAESIYYLITGIMGKAF